MRINYDKQADAVYFRLSEERVADSEEVRPGMILAFSEAGSVVGIEFLWASETFGDLANISGATPYEQIEAVVPDHDIDYVEVVPVTVPESEAKPSSGSPQKQVTRSTGKNPGIYAGRGAKGGSVKAGRG